MSGSTEPWTGPAQGPGEQDGTSSLPHSSPVAGTMLDKQALEKARIRRAVQHTFRVAGVQQRSSWDGQRTRNKQCWWGHGEREPLGTAGGNVNWCGHYGEHCAGSSKLKIEPQALSLWAFKENENGNLKRYMHPMFMEALCTLLKTWKQLPYPMMREWIKKLQCVHTRDHSSAIKEKEILPLQYMDGTRGH